MDSMGAGGGNFSEKTPVFGAPENNPMLPPTGEVEDFNDYLNERSDLKPDIERPAEVVESQESSVSEKAPEMMSSAMPMLQQKKQPKPTKNDEEGADALRDLGSISIKRDAETLPKAYMQAVSKIVNRDRKDPHKLLAEMDVARWDMMNKAFNRNRGDGLNGDGN